jgi:hypothetical protein
MKIYPTTLILTAILITGCSSTGSTTQNKNATKIVNNYASSSIEHPDIQTLITSFEEKSSSSPFSGSVVQLSGEVIAFSLTEEDLYTVTIRDGESDVLCIFNNSVAGQLGDGRPIQDGATITVLGQCFASGLFSSNSFSLDGCKIVSN